MNPEIRDTSLSTSKAFPAANANNNSDSLDVGGGNTYARRRDFELVVEIPENSILAEGVALTVTPQSSSDDGDSDAFATIPGLAAVAITGKTGDGLPDTSGAGFEVLENGNVLIAWPCPRNLEKYVRVNVAVATSGGDLTGLEYTFAVVGY